MKIAELNQKIIIIASHRISPNNFKTLRIMFRNILRSDNLLLYLGIFLISISCNTGSKKAVTETPTSGKIKISVDESFKPVIDAEVYTFVSLYQRAHLTPQFKPEYDVVNDFMNDSVKVIVTSRKLSDNQIQYLRDNLIIARTITFAYDALALITNKANNDSLIKYASVRDIFKGNVTSWKEVNPESKLDKINVIFDSNKSGNIRYFRELFGISDTLGSNFYAVSGNAEVIDYVSRNPEALGIISVNWISDKDDSLSMSFVRKVNVLAVSQQFVNDGSFYRPQQGFIYDKSYPFVRDIYLISRETFSGLGSGFIQWATSEQGQRIVLKSGLVPATMPIRLVQIKK